MNRAIVITLVVVSLGALVTLSCAIQGQISDGTATPISPESVMEMLDTIESQVIEIRGLEPKQSVPRTLLTEDELRQRVMEDFEQEYSAQEAHDDALVLAAFGAAFMAGAEMTSGTRVAFSKFVCLHHRP